MPVDKPPTDRDVENAVWRANWALYAMAVAAVIIIVWSIFR